MRTALIHDDETCRGGGAGAPALMFLHGTHDENVALQVSEYLYGQAGQPKSLVRVNWATHLLDNARDTAYYELRSWVLGAFQRWYLLQDLFCPDYLEGNAAQTSVSLSVQLQKVLSSGVFSVGRPLRSHPNDVPGKESWRVKPNRRRLQRACSEGHPLAGLVGYSALSSDSSDSHE